MAHKTLISGTAYDVKGGRELIGGTGYGCKGGKTLIGGTAFTVPFSKGIPLSTITPGAILYLNEYGSPVPFYVCKHDYESGLNGAGRTLLVRKDCYDKRIFDSRSKIFAGSSIDTWLNGTWIKLLTLDVQSAAGTTKIYYYDGSNKKAVTTRAVFLLSTAEFGYSDYADTDGEPLDSAVRKLLSTAYYGGNSVGQWTRTPATWTQKDVYVIMPSDYSTHMLCNDSYGVRPAFTIPSTFPVIQNPDGTYSQAA
jgi:hypothetical protein|nr:MAG TPA: hypothetical protein [Caudoviricetes sp.]